MTDTGRIGIAFVIDLELYLDVAYVLLCASSITGLDSQAICFETIIESMSGGNLGKSSNIENRDIDCTFASGISVKCSRSLDID